VVQLAQHDKASRLRGGEGRGGEGSRALRGKDTCNSAVGSELGPAGGASQGTREVKQTGAGGQPQNG
jgi:hypothetical protein